MNHWLCLSKEDIEKIEATVRKAELTTAGEIVPVIVRRSSAVGHVPSILFLLLVVVYFAGSVSNWFAVTVIENQWVTGGYLIAALLISRLVARLAFVERWLTAKNDQQQQVELRALSEFYQSRIKKTQDGTGILIFLSLMEHQVVVLADEGISSKLPAETWQQVVDLILGHIKKGQLGEGICQGVEKCGQLLSQHIPIKSGDRNELPNHLVIKDC